MYRRILLLTPFLLSGGVFADVLVTSEQSECIDFVDAKDEITIEVTDCVLYIRHTHVVTNCCLDYKPEVQVEGETIRVTDFDGGPPCDCLCPFDLTITIAGLEPGSYTLTYNAFLRRDPLTYTVAMPSCPEYWIRGEEVWCPLGITVTVPIYADNADPLEGFSFGTTHPLEHASMAEINLDGTLTEEVGAELLEVEIHSGDDVSPDNRGWATCKVVLDAEPPFEEQTLPPGKGQHIVNLVYDLPLPSGSVPRSISLPFVDDAGEPPVPVTFTVRGRELRPEKEHGRIQVTMPPPEFIRGDANDDRAINISDPIYLLLYLFLGGEAPPCKDAADGNDDGTLDLADAVAILNYAFLGGEIPPPSPPGPPGPDPTLDPLGCERTSLER